MEDFFSLIKTKYYKLTVFLFLFIVNIPYADAQKEKDERPPIKERIFFGGYFSLQIGTYTDIELSPVIGLWVFPRLAVAVGPSFRYYKFLDEKTDIFGLNTYAQFVFLRDFDKIIPMGIHTSLFLHIEEEILSLESEFWRRNLTEPHSHRFYEYATLAGGGISQQIGARSSVNIIFLWSVTDSEYSLYSNPEIRISFIF
ncbi:MAG TPA: hypothetical protein PLN06_03405 [Bacteroidales bacterium]|nr:hypothetical protein [Bacteroidales bacterium]HCI55538.1 hypothetical protein [Bacteroidales bacterium]HOU95653.1 hypothetical protein [Bacteroidales bacterium]HQG36022.1 hypothetical protein [Bacteroidales bacterium]HQG53172.1 hypothetical protein [Bacteroidales bacterium]